jgi:glycine/D-amino acid oxidase-like deaminating enzyme
MRVLICGGGVIGASVAYFLSCRGVKATVVERTGIACAASGKSGGFLALDWCDGTPLEALARRSFALHASLADKIGGDWGYWRLTTYGGAASSEGHPRPGRSGHHLGWLSEAVWISRRLGSADTTAQVHPGQFTAGMMQAAQDQGAELRLGGVTGLVQEAGTSRVTGVEVDGAIIEGGDAVVIAMGPWSVLAARWLSLPAVFAIAWFSIPARRSPPKRCSSSLRRRVAACSRRRCSRAPTAPPTFAPSPPKARCRSIPAMWPLIPEQSIACKPCAAACRLRSRRQRVLARQACYRPVTRDGLPLIGPVPGVQGAYVATGHSVWGILNAPATGEAMAELIVDGSARTIDLSPFDPARLTPLHRGVG